MKSEFVKIDSQYNWRYKISGEYRVFWTGEENAVDCVTRSVSFLEKGVTELRGNFAAIIESPETVIGIVDRIRSYPIFYSTEKDSFSVSNSARYLKNTSGTNRIDPLSLTEMAMAGYVTGKETLYEKLFQLQAGEYFLWNKQKKELFCKRYYRYYSPNNKGENESILIDELDAVTTDIFRKVIEKVNGRPIWVPLSGGLDSRLIVCKLKELGYDNLTAYSYGPRGNYEAGNASVVADKLGIPWHFFPIERRDIRTFYNSSERKKYQKFADNLSSVPVIQDISVLGKHRDLKIVPEAAVFINGQSGDFISGGHVPGQFISGSSAFTDLLSFITDKHYSLWKDKKTIENISGVTGKITRLIQKNELGEKPMLDKLLEYWEWQERQCKYVVNCVRIYDFLGFDWKLPLWDDAYLFYWVNIPARFKQGQYLFKKYLTRYNYKSLFKGFRDTFTYGGYSVKGWPGISKSVLPVGWLIGNIFGDSAKNNFYNYCKYFGHYRYAYGAFPYSHYLKYAKQARNPISYFVLSWLEENIT